MTHRGTERPSYLRDNRGLAQCRRCLESETKQDEVVAAKRLYWGTNPSTDHKLITGRGHRVSILEAGHNGDLTLLAPKLHIKPVEWNS
jgi:hypothetical protein